MTSNVDFGSISAGRSSGPKRVGFDQRTVIRVDPADFDSFEDAFREVGSFIDTHIAQFGGSVVQVTCRHDKSKSASVDQQDDPIATIIAVVRSKS